MSKDIKKREMMKKREEILVDYYFGAINIYKSARNVEGLEHITKDAEELLDNLEGEVQEQAYEIYVKGRTQVEVAKEYYVTAAAVYMRLLRNIGKLVREGKIGADYQLKDIK